MQKALQLKSLFQVKGPRRAEIRFVLIAAIPTILFYLIVKYYPLVSAFYMSLHDWQLMRDEQIFIGIDNYVKILSDKAFLKAIQNTVYYAFTTSIATTALGLLLAIALNPLRRGSAFMRLLYFLPNITAGIGIYVVWRWLYHPQAGLFNLVLRSMGLERVNWLGSPEWALRSIIIIGVWAGVGYTAVILLAALKNIPAMYYEAAIVDGASGAQMHRYITLPMINPVLTFVFVTSIISSFNVFMPVYILTRGGPLNASQVIAYQIYTNAFQRLWMGIASAMAFVLFALVMTLTLIQLRLRRSDEEPLV
jgi:multiple sugar transport system permease protein